ncbi:hypothetical protein [Raoultella ornithinolytica]|uniref:hypothetical protein n=1 Tax=Raoultella ornithinolytica TaxID=54291 RepID=UPI003D6F29F8
MNNDGLILNQLAERNAVLVSEVEKLRTERDQLAAESVGLKTAAEFATAPDMWIEQADGMLDYRYCDWYVDVLKAAMETPATDRIVAAQRSAFVDEAVAKITESGALTFGDCIVALCQLREGAK